MIFNPDKHKECIRYCLDILLSISKDDIKKIMWDFTCDKSNFYDGNYNNKESITELNVFIVDDVIRMYRSGIGLFCAISHQDNAFIYCCESTDCVDMKIENLYPILKSYRRNNIIENI